MSIVGISRQKKKSKLDHLFPPSCGLSCWQTIRDALHLHAKHGDLGCIGQSWIPVLRTRMTATHEDDVLTGPRLPSPVGRGNDVLCTSNQCASSQLRPMPTSAIKGTRKVKAFSISAFTICAASVANSRGHSSTNSS